MTRYTTTAVLVFGAAYLLLSAGDATGISATMQWPMALWLLAPSLILLAAAWRLDNLPGPQVVLLVSAVLLVAVTTTLWRWLALGPRSDDAGYVLSALPVAETFLLLPALLAAWLAQSLHLLRQLRDLRPDAEAISLLQSEVATLQARLDAVETAVGKAPNPPGSGSQ